MKSTSKEQKIREIVSQYGRLGTNVMSLTEDEDLYNCGMSSRATVAVMMALEDAFDIEFPDEMLRRDVFRSMQAIRQAIGSIDGAEEHLM